MISLLRFLRAGVHGLQHGCRHAGQCDFFHILSSPLPVLLLLHSIQPLLLFFCFHYMTDCGDRMMKNHPRSGKAHNQADFFPHFRFIAMHLTVRAKSFCLHKRTFIAALACVLRQCLAVRAERFFRMMVLFAVECDHLRYHLFFPLPLSLYVFLHGLFLH